MSVTPFLLRRCLFPYKGNLLSLALWICVAGVALGIIQLMLVLSVMTGFQKLLQHNYTRISSDLVVIPRESRNLQGPIGARLKTIPEIAAITPFNFGQGMVIHGGVGGVVLEGIDLKSAGAVTPWEEIWQQKPLVVEQQSHPHWIWLGAQLAKKLNVKQGENVDVLIADGESRRVIPFLVTGITKFGIYDHDLRYARIDLGVLNALFKRTGSEPMYKCKLVNGESEDAVAKKVKSVLRSAVSVKKWSDINQNIFLAVRHQKLLLFLILEIIVALAAMNVVNLLMMSSHHRKRDIAILRAMGMRFRSVLFFFVAQGAAVGFVGVIVGILAGYAVCRMVEQFQPAILSEAVYNVTKLPIHISPADVGVVALVALGLCVVCSILPAIRAALTKPVETLRYE